MNNKIIIEFGYCTMWRIMQISEDVIHHDLHNSLHPTQPHSIIVMRLKINIQAVAPGKEVDRWHIFLKTRLLRQHIIESRLTNMVSASWLWRISQGIGAIKKRGNILSEYYNVMNKDVRALKDAFGKKHTKKNAKKDYNRYSEENFRNWEFKPKFML